MKTSRFYSWKEVWKILRSGGWENGEYQEIQSLTLKLWIILFALRTIKRV